MRHQNNNLIPIISYDLVQKLGGMVMFREEDIHETSVFATELEALKYLMKDVIPCEKHCLNYRLRDLKKKAISYTERIKELEKEKRRSKNESSKHTGALSR